MKLLFDENLSHALVSRLADTFPEADHVRRLGLARATDDALWRYAGAHGFTIVSKDSDFHQRSLTLGPPPHVVWLRVGNATTAQIEELLRSRRVEIERFVDSSDEAFLALA